MPSSPQPIKSDTVFISDLLLASVAGRQVTVTAAKLMTPERFQYCLDFTGRSRRGFAAEVKARPNTVDAWATGKVSIPPTIARFLESEARHRLRNPPPDPSVWRRRGKGVTKKTPEDATEAEE
jgi:hypothetical protein